MADTADMIVPMLREIRAELSAFRGDTVRRLDAIEGAQKSFRHALTSDTLMSRLLTGEFDQRIEDLERRVRELEPQA